MASPLGSYPSRRPFIARYAAVAIFTLGVIAAFVQSAHLGLADNGDFTRLMQCIVSRPEAYALNAPAPQTPAYDVRFYNYWIPDWHIDPNLKTFASSSALLWLPAVALALIVHAPAVALPSIGGTLEAVVATFYCALLLNLVDDVVVMAVFAVGFGLMVTTCDYAAYNNTFYSEGASAVFFFAFLFALAALVLKPSRPRFFWYFVATALLSASKLQSSYILILAFIAAICVLLHAGTLNVRRLSLVFALGLLIGGPPIANIWYQSNDLRLFRYNDYDRVYDGILTFSDDPKAALAAVGGGDPACVGTIVFMPVGAHCAEAYPESLSRASALRLLEREPAIVPRMIGFAADSMQDISLEYLGKYELGDARATVLPKTGPSSWESAGHRDFYSQYPAPPADAWSHLKYALFPRGAWLFAYIAVAGCIFWFARGSNRLTAIRYCGLVSLAVCGSQMVVDIFGDGREEIIKHLYLANVAFDASLILLVAALVIVIRPLIGSRNVPHESEDTIDTSRESRLRV